MKWLLLVDFAIGAFCAVFLGSIAWLFGGSLAAVVVTATLVLLATMFVLLLVQGGARVHIKEEK